MKFIVESIYRMGTGASLPNTFNPKDNDDYSIISGYVYIDDIPYKIQVTTNSLDPRILADRIWEKAQTIIQGLEQFKELGHAITKELSK